MSSNKPLLLARDVFKNYGDRRALEPVSLQLFPGRAIALLGANGAGKSTLLRILCGLISPSGGLVERNSSLGYLSGETQLYIRLTARETLEFFGALHGLPVSFLRKRIEILTEKMQLQDFLDRPVGALSSGMRQRVNIARALIHDPPVVIFDEATTALDYISAAFIIDYLGHLCREGKSLLFSTHILSEVDFLATDLVVLDRGMPVVFCGRSEFLNKYSARTVTDALLACIET